MRWVRNIRGVDGVRFVLVLRGSTTPFMLCRSRSHSVKAKATRVSLSPIRVLLIRAECVGCCWVGVGTACMHMIVYPGRGPDSAAWLASFGKKRLVIHIDNDGTRSGKCTVRLAPPRQSSTDVESVDKVSLYFPSRRANSDSPREERGANDNKTSPSPIQTYPSLPSPPFPSYLSLHSLSIVS